MTSPKFPYWRTKNINAIEPGAQEQDRRQYEIAKAYRSEVIDASTLIELELDQVLCEAFVSAQSGLQHQFQALILRAEFCSFFQKWRLLRSLINGNSAWWQACKPSCHNEQVKQLKNLISHRNAFAHGEIVVDAKSYTTTLNFFEGKKITVELTDNYVQEILNEVEDLFPWFSEIQLNFEKINSAL